MNNGFGARLKTIRRGLGCSCARLASLSEDMGEPVTEGRIRELEAGRRKDVTVAMLFRLSRLLDVPVCCLAVNYRDPFGPSDIPGVVGMGMSNMDVSGMFAVPSLSDRPSVAADRSDELRFAVLVCRHLGNLNMLRRRNAVLRDRFRELCSGEGDSPLARPLYKALHGAYGSASEDKDREMEGAFYSFFLILGRNVSDEISLNMLRLRRLLSTHGALDRKAFDRAKESFADDMAWIQCGLHGLQEQGLLADGPAGLSLPSAVRSLPKDDRDNPYMVMRSVLDRLWKFQRRHPTDLEGPRGLELIPATEYVNLYFLMAECLNKVETFGTSAGRFGLYDDMDKRFASIMQRYGLPPFEVLMNQ